MNGRKLPADKEWIDKTPIDEHIRTSDLLPVNELNELLKDKFSVTLPEDNPDVAKEKWKNVCGEAYHDFLKTGKFPLDKPIGWNTISEGFSNNDIGLSYATPSLANKINIGKDISSEYTAYRGVDIHGSTIGDCVNYPKSTNKEDHINTALQKCKSLGDNCKGFNYYDYTSKNQICYRENMKDILYNNKKTTESWIKNTYIAKNKNVFSPPTIKKAKVSKDKDKDKDNLQLNVSPINDNQFYPSWIHDKDNTKECHNLLSYVPTDYDPDKTINKVTLDNCSLPVIATPFLTDSNTNMLLNSFQNFTTSPTQAIRDICPLTCQAVQCPTIPPVSPPPSLGGKTNDKSIWTFIKTQEPGNIMYGNPLNWDGAKGYKELYKFYTQLKYKGDTPIKHLFTHSGEATNKHTDINNKPLPGIPATKKPTRSTPGKIERIKNAKNKIDDILNTDYNKCASLSPAKCKSPSCYYDKTQPSPICMTKENIKYRCKDLILTQYQSECNDSGSVNCVKCMKKNNNLYTTCPSPDIDNVIRQLCSANIMVSNKSPWIHLDRFIAPIKRDIKIDYNPYDDPAQLCSPPNRKNEPYKGNITFKRIDGPKETDTIL